MRQANTLMPYDAQEKFVRKHNLNKWDVERAFIHFSVKKKVSRKFMSLGIL